MTHRLQRGVAYARRSRCSVLLAALCLLVLINPLLSGSVIGAAFLGFCLLAILASAVWALRALRLMAWTVVAPALVVAQAIIVDRLGGHALRPVVLAATAAFIGAVTIALLRYLRYLLDWHPITTDKVSARLPPMCRSPSPSPACSASFGSSSPAPSMSRRPTNPTAISAGRT